MSIAARTALALAALVLLGGGNALAQTPTSTAPPLVAGPGSTAFCLFEIPVEDVAKRRWVNLAHVQYVESAPTGIKLYFGGGNFGAGHEALIPAATATEAQVVMERLRRAAASCTGVRGNQGLVTP